MRILLSINNLGIGGVQTYLVNLANGLCLKHQVWIYVHYPYSAASLHINMLDSRVTVLGPHLNGLRDDFYWKLNGFATKFGVKRNLWEFHRNYNLRQEVKKNAIDVILSFDQYSDGILAKLPGILEIPIILSLHGQYDSVVVEQLNKEDRKRLKRIFSQVRGVTYKTVENIRILEELGPFPNIIVSKHILHGISFKKPDRGKEQIRNSLGIPADAFVFSMIARGDPSKGWQEAIQAFLDLSPFAESTRPLYFLAQGDGGYFESLKHKYQENKRIIFLPSTYNTNEVVSITEAGLLPSYFRTENYSFTVIEYLIAGVPVIVTEHGNLRETISSDAGLAGIVIDLTTLGTCDVKALRDAMLLCYQDQETLEKMKSLTNKAAEKFNYDRFIEEYESLLEKILS